VLRAARESANISLSDLASKVSMPEDAIRAWEQGSRQLAWAPASHVEELQAALRCADGRPELIADIEVAACCDLVALAISQGEESASLAGNSASTQTAFADLLAWSVVGRVPARYQSNPRAPRSSRE
jgi:hypothetical protein